MSQRAYCCEVWSENQRIEASKHLTSDEINKIDDWCECLIYFLYVAIQTNLPYKFVSVTRTQPICYSKNVALTASHISHLVSVCTKI